MGRFDNPRDDESRRAFPSSTKTFDTKALMAGILRRERQGLPLVDDRDAA